MRNDKCVDGGWWMVESVYCEHRKIRKQYEQFMRSEFFKEFIQFSSFQGWFSCPCNGVSYMDGPKIELQNREVDTKNLDLLISETIHRIRFWKIWFQFEISNFAFNTNHYYLHISIN